MVKYRRRFEIIADIISAAEKGAKKTRIMYFANLSYKLLFQYLVEVTEAGLISFEKEDRYVLTVKGKAFLNKHEEYSKRCRSLEEHLNHVNNEKTVLEKMCFNTGKAGRNLSRVDRNKGSRR